MHKKNLLFLLPIFLLTSLSFSLFTKAVDPGCSEQTPTCLGSYKVDVYACNEDPATGKCSGGTHVTRQATVYCDGSCAYNICSSNDTITCTTKYFWDGSIKVYYCEESGCDTPGNCCGGSSSTPSPSSSSSPPPSCSDSCSVHKLVDHNGDCIKNSICGTQVTRYTGGECGVCPLNNNSCSSKYSGNAQTSKNCVIPKNMWSDADFTISHKVTFSASATLTVGSNLILNSGGKITVSSGATVVFYIGKEIKMQGGKISLTGGYILKQNP